MTENKPLISIVIPVKNGMSTLSSCLDSIFSQTLIDKTEIIIIDSASTDGTLEFLKKYDVHVHNLDPQKFNHGETRNLGVNMAKGEFVLMTVQDATFADNKVLEMMVDDFRDPEIIGVCGQQIVFDNKSKNPLQWFRPQSEATPYKVKFENPKSFTDLVGKQQHEYCTWDDVIAMYRRDEKLKLPFRKLMFSEDTMWAKDALSEGKAIMYDYRARVDHYHHQNFNFYFKRSYIILYQNYKFYNYIKTPDNFFKKIIQIKIRLFKMSGLSLGERFKWIFYNINLVLATWKATIIFSYYAKFKGINGVEKSQKKYVGLPPQGVQAKN